MIRTSLVASLLMTTSAAAAVPTAAVVDVARDATPIEVDVNELLSSSELTVAAADQLVPLPIRLIGGLKDKILAVDAPLGRLAAEVGLPRRTTVSGMPRTLQASTSAGAEGGPGASRPT